MATTNLHPVLEELDRRRRSGELSTESAWCLVRDELRKGKAGFDSHLAAYRHVYGEGPGAAWIPESEAIARTNLGAFLAEKGLADVPAAVDWAGRERETFWSETASRLGIRFQKAPARVLDVTAGVESAQWFAGATLNIAESCFQAPEDATAIVCAKPGEAPRRLTYGELHALSNRFANGLLRAGFVKGDAIAINMPMTIESVAAYLGIVAAGCAVVSIADSFAPEEIAVRLRIAKAKGIVTQDAISRGGKRIPLYEKVVAAGAPRAIVVGTGASVSLRPDDVRWEDFLSPNEIFQAVGSEPRAPINILFSSGTTGEPKAIPWDHTTPLKCGADGHFHQDIQPSDVVAWPTNLGWMMGPWLIFATFLNRATMALYYDAPLDRGFGEFVRDARVTVLGLVPSLVKTWRASRCMEGLDWRGIKCFSSTGECSNAEDYLYLMWLADYRPVIEYCGGTEIGGGFISGTLAQPAAPGAFTTPTLGLRFHILDEAGRPCDNGELYLVPPCVGLSTRLLNRDHHEVYYKDTPKGPAGELLRRHGDQFERIGGFYRGHGRVDDTMNLGGIKVSSAEIERAVNRLDEVIESAAIAVTPPGGGPSELVLFVVSSGERDPKALLAAARAAIKMELNPLFKVTDLRVVDKLPRTASNKVMRRVLRSEYRRPGS